MLAHIAEAMAAASKPALVVGASVANDDAWDEVIELAERHRALVYVSPLSGRNSFPENHRLFAGFLDAFRERIVSRLQSHDVILVLGAPAFLYHVEGSGDFLPKGSRLYQLVDDAAMASWAPVGLSVVASLRSGIRDLLAGPRPSERAWPEELQRPHVPDRGILSDRYLMSRIAALRPSGSVIVEEAPSTRGPLHDHLPITDRDGYYTVASGGLGYGLPAAVGVSLGRPKVRIISIVGDGSAMYSIQALWTAAQFNLPITFIIVKNGGYASLVDFGRILGLQQTVGTQVSNLDFVALANGHGLPASAVVAADHLDDALRAAFTSTGPTLLEVEIDQGSSRWRRS